MEEFILTEKEKKYFSSLAKQIKKDGSFSNHNGPLKFKISLQDNENFNLLLDSVISGEVDSVIALKNIIENTNKIKQFESKFKLDRKNKLKLKENNISSILKNQNEFLNNKNEFSNFSSIFESLNNQSLQKALSFIEKNKESYPEIPKDNSVSPLINKDSSIIIQGNQTDSEITNYKEGNSSISVDLNESVRDNIRQENEFPSEIINTDSMSKVAVLEVPEIVNTNSGNNFNVSDLSPINSEIEKEDYDFNNIIKEPILIKSNSSEEGETNHYEFDNIELDSINDFQQVSDSNFSINSGINPVILEEDSYIEPVGESEILTGAGSIAPKSKSGILENYEISDKNRIKMLKDSHKKIIKNAVPNILRKNIMTGSIEDYATNVNYDGFNLNSVGPSEYLPSIEDNQFAVESSIVNEGLNLGRPINQRFANQDYQMDNEINRKDKKNKNSSDIDEHEIAQWESILNEDLFEDKKEEVSSKTTKIAKDVINQEKNNNFSELDGLNLEADIDKNEKGVKSSEIEVKDKDNSFVNIDDLNLDFVPEVQTTSLDLDSNFFKEVRNLSSSKGDSEILKLKIRPFYIFLTIIVICLIIYIGTLISFGDLIRQIKFALGL